MVGKSKDKQGREPRKEPQGEALEPTRDARDQERMTRFIRESDRAYAAYWATLDPRQQALMPRP